MRNMSKRNERNTVNECSDNNTVLQKMPVMKTLNEMVELTGFSYMHLRQLCLDDEIVYVRAGKKYYINYDKFCDYLNGVC